MIMWRENGPNSYDKLSHSSKCLQEVSGHVSMRQLVLLCIFLLATFSCIDVDHLESWI